MKKVLLGMCMLTAAVGASAQIDSNDKQLFNHLGAGVSVGTDGIGFNLATTITPYVQMRAGVSIMPAINVKGIEAQLNVNRSQVEDINHNIDLLKAVEPQFSNLRHLDPPANLEMQAKLNMTNAKVLFDIYPTKTSAWRLTVGFYAGKSQLVDAWTTNCQNELETITEYNKAAGYVNSYGVSQAYFPQVGVEIGDYLVKPNGPTARAYMKVNGFKPYVGIGSGRAISNKHRFSFAWDLGAQFWGTPTVYVQDNPLTPGNTSGDAGKVLKTISKITVYPTLSFRFNGRIL